MNKYEDMDKFISLFTKLKKEKELEDLPNNPQSPLTNLF